MSVTQLVSGNLKTWQGLSGQETLDTLTQAVGPVSSVHNDGRRARGPTLFDVFIIERNASPRTFEGWFRVGDDQLSVLETDDPVVHDLTGILEAFGSPDEILEQKRFAMGVIV